MLKIILSILIGSFICINTMSSVNANQPSDILLDAQEIQDTSLKNARRTETGILMMGIRGEGYASSSQAEQIAQELWDEGIRVIFSLHPPDRDITNAFREKGFVLIHEQYETMHEDHWNFHWWLGYDIPWQDAVHDMISQYPAEQIAIHCSHGVDRAGNLMAYILAVYYGVPIEDAWYAVVDPHHTNLNGLADVLEEYGIHDRRNRSDEGVAIYSYNGTDGMKAHTSGFRNYIRNTIDAAIERGASFGPEHLTE